MINQAGFDVEETKVMEKVRAIIITPPSLTRLALGNSVPVIAILVIILLIQLQVLPQYCVWVAAIVLVYMIGEALFVQWGIAVYGQFIKKLCGGVTETLVLDGREIQLIKRIQRSDLTKRFAIVSSVFYVLPVAAIICLLLAAHILDSPDTVNWLILVYASFLAWRLIVFEKRMIDCLHLLRKIDGCTAALGEKSSHEDARLDQRQIDMY